MKQVKDSTLYKIWGAFCILCAVLGFIPEPNGLVKALLVLLAVIFFLPGALLLQRGIKEKNKARLCFLRNLSLLSLGLTLLMLVINFLSVAGGEVTGALLYGLLVVVSTPMVCGQYWIVSLFLWACMLMTTLSYLKKLKKA